MIDSVGGLPAAVAVVTPGDRTSGTCGSGCLDGNCRAHINDFTCGNGFEGPRGDVAFKLTRIRRPSPPPTADAGLDQVLECVPLATTGFAGLVFDRSLVGLALPSFSGRVKP